MIPRELSNENILRTKLDSIEKVKLLDMNFEGLDARVLLNIVNDLKEIKQILLANKVREEC